jgi:hypothetical protein
MSRLKRNANYVSPFIHKQVEQQMANPEGNTSQVLNAQMDFVIAKRLLADLPIVPTNERTYELCQEIQMGVFSDCGDPDENWEEWKQRAREILEAKGVFVLKQSRLKRVAKNPIVKVKYNEGLASQVNQYLSEHWDLGDGECVARALSAAEAKGYDKALTVVVCEEEPDMIEESLQTRFGNKYFLERISEYTIGLYDPNLGYGYEEEK